MRRWASCASTNSEWSTCSRVAADSADSALRSDSTTSMRAAVRMCSALQWCGSSSRSSTTWKKPSWQSAISVSGSSRRSASSKRASSLQRVTAWGRGIARAPSSGKKRLMRSGSCAGVAMATKKASTDSATPRSRWSAHDGLLAPISRQRTSSLTSTSSAGRLSPPPPLPFGWPAAPRHVLSSVSHLSRASSSGSQKQAGSAGLASSSVVSRADAFCAASGLGAAS
mmetsp:Transcript_25651/g.82310  ORF Transcript_25651/g.82310 Transcript_25651/m.82310 type:complete len:226 (-) Transcript_25651:761-1438(-)